MNKFKLGFGMLLALMCWGQEAISAVPDQPAIKHVSANEVVDSNEDAAKSEVEFSLLQLGVKAPLSMIGGDAISSVDFSFNVVRLIKRIRLNLHYSYSPLLNPANSFLKVELNGHEVAVLNLLKGKSKDAEALIEIDPLMLQEWNHLTFHYTGHLVKPFCDDPRSLKNWLQINNEDTHIESSADLLPVAMSMSLFPQQFFDRHDMHDMSMALVLPNKPSWGVLQSAGVIASWFGSQAEWRKVRFPSYLNTLPNQSAIVLATTSDVIDGVTLPPVTGKQATITIVKHPTNPLAYLLLVVGRDEQSLLAATRTMVTTRNRPDAAKWDIQADKLAERKPFDAPGWLTENKVIRLDEVLPKEGLHFNSLMAGPLEMVLHLPPDLYRSPATTVPINLAFESSNNSRYLRQINAFINNYAFQVQRYDMPDSNDPKMVKTRLKLRIPSERLTGKDTISIRFTFIDKETKVCETAFVTDEIKIDPGSTIDLEGQPRRVTLPDLRYLAYNGFPYSKMADLSETVVLLPDSPDHNEIDSMLTLLGHVGNKSGYPATGVSVASIKQAEKFADKDILVIGSLTGLRPLLESWASDIQVNLLGKDQPSPKLGLDLLHKLMHWGEQTLLFNGLRGEQAMVLVGFESPMQSQRSVVMLTARDSSNLLTEAITLNTLDKAKDFNGDVVVISSEDSLDSVVAFDWAEKYSNGRLTFWQWFNDNKTHNPVLAALAAILLTLLFAAQAYYKFRRKADKRLGKVMT
ncbi:MAG: cellulose biosynthesis cyclic di-GMP-binding regulatory protein BcsB [Gallionella sp.]|nr:cellulose biosynthesis cyclic di-GMP-binding regulatory protein BcsB [Gallionella sp.]MDD4945729.1 cellulose biosynthesis cyclic di-GMP-binding regulatory protein BcsB [Gallionella sp.]